MIRLMLGFCWEMRTLALVIVAPASEERWLADLRAAKQRLGLE